MSNHYLEAIKNRRSQYMLGKDLPLAEQEVTALIKEAIRQAPSAFNSQSSRAVILYGAQNQKFWNIVKYELQKTVPAASLVSTEAKISSFVVGAGTVLFYEDQDVIEGLQEKFANYADNFPVWSEHSTGIAQFAVWTTLSEANIGASLQHYNPLIDTAIAAEWNIPPTWKLCAQMPFGSHQGKFSEKEFMADEDRFIVL